MVLEPGTGTGIEPSTAASQPGGGGDTSTCIGVVLEPGTGASQPGGWWWH